MWRSFAVIGRGSSEITRWKKKIETSRAFISPPVTPYGRPNNNNNNAVDAWGLHALVMPNPATAFTKRHHRPHFHFCRSLSFQGTGTRQVSFPTISELPMASYFNTVVTSMLADSYIQHSVPLQLERRHWKYQNMLTFQHLICSSRSLWRCWAQLMSQQLIFLKTWVVVLQLFPTRNAKAFFCCSGCQCFCSISMLSFFMILLHNDALDLWSFQ